jgi:uncharacterized membrane protein YphA (DoxX/SURF4 family)
LRFIIGVFFVLHGLVHLLYFGQSQRFFELRPGMVWPDGSWAFSRLFGDQVTRMLASISFVVAAVGFVAGGVGLMLGQTWWPPLIVGSAAFSAAVTILFWDGRMQALDEKGGIGLLIDIAILVALLIFQWPAVGF